MEAARKDVPPGVVEVLRKMLAKLPPDRFQTPGEVAQALARFVPQPPPSTDKPRRTKAPAPPGTAGRGGRPARRRRRWVLLALVALLFLGLGGAGFALIGLGSPGEQQAARSSRAASSAERTNVRPSSRATERTAPPNLPATKTTDTRPNTSDPNPAPANLVTIAAVSTKKSFSTAPAEIEKTIYIDRDYWIRELSPNLQGATLIRTACDDKFVTSAVYLTFRVSSPVLVYVGYDARATAVPGWLNEPGWELTKETLAENIGVRYKMYARKFEAGTITLGGNRVPPAAFAGKESGNHYIVLVKR
jgi:hypothetical protein